MEAQREVQQGTQTFCQEDIHRALIALASAGRDRGDEYRMALIDMGIAFGLIPLDVGSIHVNNEIREMENKIRKTNAGIELARASERLDSLRRRAWQRQALCIGNPPEDFMRT